MMVIALVGLAANLISAWSLMRKSDIEGNINVRSAYLHILGDALGSVGAILAGLLMLLFDWYIADPIISVIVALLILRSAWQVVNHTIHILMEGTPTAIDAREVEETLVGDPRGEGSARPSHLDDHLGLESLSCHLIIEDDQDCQVVLQEAIRRIEERFRIQHTTIQIEKSQRQHAHLRI